MVTLKESMLAAHTHKQVANHSLDAFHSTHNANAGLCTHNTFVVFTAPWFSSQACTCTLIQAQPLCNVPLMLAYHADICLMASMTCRNNNHPCFHAAQQGMQRSTEAHQHSTLALVLLWWLT
jgi:hypothetical protein